MSARAPMVIDRGGKSPRGWDVYSRLLEERVIFLTGPIDTDVSIAVIAQLLFLNYSNSQKDISIYINSPGGSVTAGLAIYDTMQYVTPDVQTTCIGEAASMGALLLTAGTKGKRHALPNAKMMIHQPQAGYAGQVSDLEIHTAEVLRTKSKLESILALHTGKDQVTINLDTDRNRYMTSEESVAYGLIDTVVVNA